MSKPDFQPTGSFSVPAPGPRGAHAPPPSRDWHIHTGLFTFSISTKLHWWVTIAWPLTSTGSVFGRAVLYGLDGAFMLMLFNKFPDPHPFHLAVDIFTFAFYLRKLARQCSVRSSSSPSSPDRLNPTSVIRPMLHAYSWSRWICEFGRP